MYVAIAALSGGHPYGARCGGRSRGPVNLDSVRVVFNEERLVSDAGLLVTATPADRLGIEELVNESVWLDSRAPGACLPGRKVMSLVHGCSPGPTASMK